MHNDFKKPFLIFSLIFVCLGFGLCLFIYLLLGDCLILFPLLKIILIFLLIYLLMTYSLLLFISTKLDSFLDTIDYLFECICHKKTITLLNKITHAKLSKLVHQAQQILHSLTLTPHNLHPQQSSLKTFALDISAQAHSPLTNLFTYYSSLLETPLTHEEHTQLLMQSKSQLDKLNWLLKASIMVSDLESNFSSPHFNNCSLKQLLTSAISNIYDDSLAKNIELQFHMSEDTLVYCDKCWTLKALYHLLDNAVKYSFTNTVITLTVIGSATFTQIAITNQGIPIKLDEVDLIFQRFYRNPQVNELEGFGIGLYLTRLILEKQNGRIKVLSSEETTTFLVFLPLQVS